MLADVPSIESINLLLPNLSEDTKKELIHFLEKIECPPDFRGFDLVGGYLFDLATNYPMAFDNTFQCDVGYFKVFVGADPTHFPDCFNIVMGKGWKSERPLYALFTTFALQENPPSAEAVLFFVQHYLSNESILTLQQREEESFRAFRYTLLNDEFDASCLNSTSIDTICSQLEIFREKYASQNQQAKASNLEHYIRVLSHFYSLDWKPRVSRKRRSAKTIRASYSTSKMELLPGSAGLYSLIPKKTSKSQELIDSGLIEFEDIPPISVVKVEPESGQRLEFEMPNVAMISSLEKVQKQKNAITRSVQKAHNTSQLSRTHLQPHELSFLWKELTANKSRSIAGLPVKTVQAFIILSLFFGRDVKRLKSLKIIKEEKSDGDGFFYEHQWYCKVLYAKTAKNIRHPDNPNLLKTKSYAIYRLPNFLPPLLDLDSNKVGHSLFSKCSEERLLKAAQQFYRSINKTYHCQISHKAVEHFIAHKIDVTTDSDPVILDYLRGYVGYHTRTQRHYTRKLDQDVELEIWSIWRNVFDDISIFEIDFENPMAVKGEQLSLEGVANDRECEFGTGSEFTPTVSCLRSVVSDLKRALKVGEVFTTSTDLAKTLEYHNAYTLYTLYMLLSATGYRAVYNPLPSLSLNMMRYGLLCISDKDSSSCFAHTRLVATPSVLEAQLVNYKNHLSSLAALINPLKPSDSEHFFGHTSDTPQWVSESRSERLERFNAEKHARHPAGPLVLYELAEHARKSKLKVSRPGYISELASLESLPYNFGRHYLRNYLKKQRVSQELIQFQMGHWVAGQLPGSAMSTCSHSEAVNILRPHLDLMMSDIGWTAECSVLARKR